MFSGGRSVRVRGTIAAALFFDDAGSEFTDGIVRMRVHVDLQIKIAPSAQRSFLNSVLGLRVRLAQAIREIRRGQARMRWQWCFS